MDVLRLINMDSVSTVKLGSINTIINASLVMLHALLALITTTVSHVHQDTIGLSPMGVYALPVQVVAQPVILQEFALHASKVITITMITV